MAGELADVAAGEVRVACSAHYDLEGSRIKALEEERTHSPDIVCASAQRGSLRG